MTDFLDHPWSMTRLALPTSPTNIIFAGVAGSGKTYYLRQLQQLYDEHLETIPIEQVAEQQVAEHSWREVLCAVLLSEERSMSVPEMLRHPLIQVKMAANGRTDNVSQTLWGQLNLHSHPDSQTVTAPRRSANYYFDKTADNAWYLLDEVKADLRQALSPLSALIPVLSSTGHSLVTASSHNVPIAAAHSPQSARISRSTLVSFHQAYGYEEFVEGIRPVVGAQSQISYQIQPGAFLKLCHRAAKDPEHRYAMLIDEINRANVSRVFGELMTLIEPDKRAGQPNSLQVALAYSGQAFTIPSNVDIYATMNTQDHSLSALDLAFRRRFRFIDCPPMPQLLSTLAVTPLASEQQEEQEEQRQAEQQIDLAQILIGLNQRLCQLLGQDSQLGHAYLMGVTSLAELQTVLIEQIIPQLAQMTGQQAAMMQFVLNDTQQPLKRQFIHDQPQGAPAYSTTQAQQDTSPSAYDTGSFRAPVFSHGPMSQPHSGYWINPDLLARRAAFMTAEQYWQLY